METLWQLEANIDDMNPQNMEYVFSRILDKGANDVWAMPMMMKKGRMRRCSASSAGENSSTI
mgnify:FL=1